MEYRLEDILFLVLVSKDRCAGGGPNRPIWSYSSKAERETYDFLIVGSNLFVTTKTIKNTMRPCSGAGIEGQRVSCQGILDGWPIFRFMEVQND